MIPTAEEFLNQHTQISHFYDDYTKRMVCFSDEVEKAIIEFAKLHVEAALKNADRLCKVNIIHWTDWESKPDIILTSYPKSLIK